MVKYRRIVYQLLQGVELEASVFEYCRNFFAQGFLNAKSFDRF